MGWSSPYLIANLVVIEGGNDGLFIYNGAPALGNLIISAAPVAGTDPYGNAYPQGIGLTGTGGQLIAQLGNQFLQLQANAGVGPALSFNPDLTAYKPGQAYSIVSTQPELSFSSPFPIGGNPNNAALLVLGGRNPAGTITSLITIQSDGPGQNGPVMSECGWNAITLKTGFLADPGTFTPAIMVTGPTTAKLSGVIIKSGGANFVTGDIPFQLPATLQPLQAQFFTCAGVSDAAGNTVRLEIDSTGTATVVFNTTGYSTSFVSLDGIQLRLS